MKWISAVLLVSVVAALATPIFVAAQQKVAMRYEDQQIFNQIHDQLRQFTSYEELLNFVKTSFDNYYSGNYIWSSGEWHGGQFFSGAVPFSLAVSSRDGFSFRIDDSGSFQVNQLLSDYSITNSQILGVDEADIVKTDGNFIYIIRGKKILILDANPAENEILSEIRTMGRPIEMFIVGDKLAVFGTRAFGYLDEFDSSSPPVYPAEAIITTYSTKTFVEIYDITDRKNPSLNRYIWLEGSYFDSRKIGDHIYIVINTQVIFRDNRVDLPELFTDEEVETIQAPEICYFDNVNSWPLQFVTILSINVQTEEESRKTFLMDSTQAMFVSSSNIYMVRYNWSTAKTGIYKITVSEGEVRYGCYGEVPGHVLNRFSMDEYQRYFRIATTTGDTWNRTSKNNVYILDGSLNLVGKLENIAPGERIYSARFIGTKAYMVTFRQVDPFFVVDLSDSRNPRVLGELKIPGYSDYLYPYDENHVIGIGRDIGVKISLFDVSDAQNPQEVSKFEAGGRRTDSYALQNHKALLFSRRNNLLVIPIGDYWSQDAYVFRISAENGIELKGTITHKENNAMPENEIYTCSRWRYDSSRSIMRSLYIGDALYTISEGMMKINSLADLSEVGKVNLVQ
ncbi:MAG: beta-propeller domain-containing protein [Candidatus Hadarchaeota archaeon]